MMGASYEDRVCLWPTGDTQEPENYPNGKVRSCDRYDASNLASKTDLSNRNEVKIGVASDTFDYQNAAIGGLVYMRADAVAEYLLNKSNMGGTPISYLVVAGHSGRSGISGKDAAGNGKDASWYRFNTESLTAIDKELARLDKTYRTSFNRAKKRWGPSRCWFTRDAVAFFAGCASDEAIADPFAKQILRKGSVAYGNTQWTKWTSRGVWWESEMFSGDDDYDKHARWDDTTEPIWEPFYGHQ